MRFLQLVEVQPCVAKPYIGEIVFNRSTNILFSLDVITHRTVDQERITKIFDISGNGHLADRLLLTGLLSNSFLFSTGVYTMRELSGACVFARTVRLLFEKMRMGWSQGLS